MKKNLFDMVSVIIPIKNPEKEVFTKCLTSILDQTYSNIEIIIVDASDKRPEILDEFKNITYIRQKRKHVSGARQDGLDVAKGKYVVGLDSDCIAKSNWIEEIITSFDEENNGFFVIGKSHSLTDGMIVDNIQKEYDEWVRHITCEIAGKCYSLTIDSKNYGFITKYGKQIGFDENLISGEDMDFATRTRRKGYKIMYNPSAIVNHIHRQDIKSLIRQKMWHGKGYGQNMVKNNIDFDFHFQMLNLILLIGAVVLFPISMIFASYILITNGDRIRLVFSHIFYWSFSIGTIKGMYKEGGMKFLLLKIYSDICKNMPKSPKVHYI